MTMRKRVILEKHIGETPLECLERYRTEHPALRDTPMAYAGRLDPLASGKLLVLIGDECKRQKAYHDLDKEYVIEVVFGIGTDTGYVMGRIDEGGGDPPHPRTSKLRALARTLSGTDITLPYPVFSARTVHGKPLHTWACEGRLDEIDIPVKTARLHRLRLMGARTMSGKDLADTALVKMDTIPPVTDERKALGNDFRRPDIRNDWRAFARAHGTDTYTVATFRVRASSGMYMRALAHHLAALAADTHGICLSIDRTMIGRYIPLGARFGFFLPTRAT